MPTEAIVTLEQLHCISLKNTELHVEPYIWPALIKFDDTTIGAPDRRFVDVITPTSASSHVVIKDNMRPGETAPIPSQVRTLRTQLEGNIQHQRLILIVVLLETDETPKNAMLAGFRAYVEELRAAFKKEGRRLLAAELDNDVEGKEEIIDRIKTRVSERIRAAIRGALSNFEKFETKFFGILDNDDFLGTGFLTFGNESLESTPLTVDFKTKSTTFKKGRNFVPPKAIHIEVRFEIKGQLQVRNLGAGLK